MTYLAGDIIVAPFGEFAEITNNPGVSKTIYVRWIDGKAPDLHPELHEMRLATETELVMLRLTGKI